MSVALARFEVPPFVPARGLASPHAQTVFANFARPSRLPPVVRERWDTPDGDVLDVLRLTAPPDAPHALLLHGLESRADSGYMATTLRTLGDAGFGVCALAFRSCGFAPNKQPRTYHAGETDDALFALARMRARVRGPLVAVGFSLGGSVLLNLLARTGDAAPIVAGATVSAPLDLAPCVDRLDRGRGWVRLYRERFLLRLKRKAREKGRRFPGLLDLDAVAKARTIRRFDTLVTAPLHGFESADHYYAEASAGPHLGRIARPVLMLHADDDPLVPGATLPPSFGDHAPLVSVRTQHGGHVAFVAGTPLRPHFWFEPLVARFLTDALAATPARSA
jgi:predicted alpha/beta-fold hydrolase